MCFNEPQILLRLQGGLGNLMFQIAGLKSFEQLTNKTIGFTNFKNQAQEYYNIGRTLFPDYQTTILSPVGNLDFNSKIERDCFEEPEEGYADLKFLLNQSQAFLNCYLQNHNLFLDEKFIKSLFNLQSISIDNYYKHTVCNYNCVSMHVRRTDYTHIQHILPCQTIDYYTNALEEMGNYEHLFIFSDDPFWCYNNLNFKKRIIVENNELESLRIMSMCQKHIIANSTFSWWGAYLSNSDNVILPAKWFGPAITSPRPINHYKLDKWTAI
jgi:hypothetical protein